MQRAALFAANPLRPRPTAFAIASFSPALHVRSGNCFQHVLIKPHYGAFLGDTSVSGFDLL